MNTEIPDEKLAAIKEALFRGQKIQAIKLYRNSIESGLAEAKTAVEKLEADLRTTSPEKFSAKPLSVGSFGVLMVVFLVVIAAFLLWARSR
jgi:hypothetical protein